MNEAIEKNLFLTIKWSIDNFSYWNNEIHDKVIETEAFCLSSGTPLKIELYPRGPSGREEHLLVRVVHGIQDGFSGDLSFFGSDCSLICKQQINEEKESTFIELPIGPKFKDVVARSRKNEVFHKDQLTLQLRKRHFYEEDHRMFTMIDVFDTSVRISTKVFKNFDSTSASLITKFEHPLDDGGMGRMSLWASRDKLGDYRMELALEPTSSEENVLVLTYMSVLNVKNDLIRTEENENIIRNDYEQWAFTNSLKEKELTGKDYTLFIRFKIIPNNKYKHRCGTLSCHPGAVITMPTDNFRILGLSVPGETYSKSTKPSTSPRPENSLKDSNTPPEPENALKVLAKEYWHLYRNHDFTDVQLRSCEDSSFVAHKSILSARSPVLKSMLQMSSNKDILDFPDMDAPTLGRFLIFLYSGTVDILPWQSAFKLYSAAEKYQVPTLKRKCVAVLCKSLAISNAQDIRSLAEKHHDDELKSAADIFMLKNYEHFRNDPEDRIRVF